MEAPEISIIGLGGLGGTLGRALTESGLPLKSVFNRTRERALQLADSCNIDAAGVFPAQKNDLGRLVFITVPDDSISGIAGRLSGLAPDFTGYIFVHCSGNEPAGLLADLKKKGALTVSFHPLQTFNRLSEPSDFNGIFCSLQGDAEAFPVLRDLAERLGARTLEVDERQKSHLHVAAVFASNYLLALLDSAVDTAKLGGLPAGKVKQALLPLVQTTLENARVSTTGEVLTGPIKRGDTETIKHHLKLLQKKPDIRALYSQLGLKTIEIARSANDIDESEVKVLRELLNGE